MPSPDLILKHCVVAIADDLEDYDWREEKVRQWVSYHGGKFSSTVEANVTHLLCTEANFKKKVAAVQTALKTKDTKIVMRDWLEDSINKRTCLKTHKYDLTEQFKHEGAQKRKAKETEKNSKLSENYVDPGFWHVYRDSTYFEYQILLTRNDEENGIVGEKHLLTLWESNAKPYNYKCTTLYTKKSKIKAVPFAFQDYPVDLQTAFKTFKGFFRKRTGIAWNDRISKTGTRGPDQYQYQPPSGGKPVGLINEHTASISKEGAKDSYPADANEVRETDHNENIVDGDRGAELPHKRPRDEHVADQTAMNGNDEQRPLKKFRQEMAATAPVPAETKADADADANNHDLVADSNSECEQVVRQALAHGELTFHDEAAQDVSEADGIQLSFDDVVGTGALQPVDDDEVRRDARGVNGIQLQYRSAVHDGTSEIDEDYKESHPIHNSTGEVYIKRTISDNEDDENDDGGLTAPPNSDAGDEEEKEGEEDDVQDQDQDQDQTETVGNFNHDTAMTDLQEVDGEVEATDFNEEGEEEEAQAISIEDKHIRAAAMSIYEEARHSVDFARDSQAALIDTAQQGKAHVRARAKTRTERRDRLMAESEADSDISEC